MHMTRTGTGLITNALHNSHTLFIEIAENAAVLFFGDSGHASALGKYQSQKTTATGQIKQ